MLFDFDDAIYLPHSSQANRWISWIKYPEKVEAIVKYSTHVIVGNSTLQEYVQRYHRRVSIIPTSIDIERYRVRPKLSSQTEPLTIGWVGSGTTVQYLDLLNNVFRQLARHHNFRLVIVGGAYQLPGVEVVARPWTLKNEISDLHSFDIGVMPLPDNQWTQGKGGFKAIQYMGVGVPAVASPVGMNTEIIKHNENGFLPNSEQGWIDCLAALLEDAALRRRLGLAGRTTVQTAYSVQANAPKLLKLLLSQQR
ncbi:MAG: glycosyltransferase family 4 protein [Anaerolineae bacterium]|nr:glycosyltransferase family 4 protein [Anaerolineae bacterium]